MALKPIAVINGYDMTKYIEEAAPVDNDLDADNSGRNTLDGLMWRKRVSTKEKWSFKFLTLPSKVMSEFLKAYYSSGDYIEIKVLDALENRYITKTFYSSSVNKGVQMWENNDTVYEGVSFTPTQR